MLRQSYLGQGAGKAKTVQQTEAEGNEPRQRAVKPGFPCRAFRISTATSMMLSAIVASTGGPGTLTNPSVAAASVMLWAMVKAVTVRRRVASREPE